MTAIGRWFGRSMGAWFGALESTAGAAEPDAGFRGVVGARDGGIRRRIRRKAAVELDQSERDIENAGVLIAAGIF